jgi:hypothetical protein
MSYFDYCHGLRMTSEKLHRLFGGPPRRPDSPREQRPLDIAASIPQLTEDVVLRMTRYAREQTGLRNVCLAGGVALNAVANGRVLREGPFEELWIQPAAGDAGGALGAALLVWHQLLGNVRTPCPADTQHGSLLGPGFDAEQVRACLNQRGAAFREFPNEATLCTEVAGLLAAQKVVGWFQGRMEFGPRALGSRSILADPRDARMQKLLNLKIKFRESFRPFAPAVLAEYAAEYFELPAGHSSPYMLLVTDVCPSKRLPLSAEREPPGLTRQAIVRSRIPAVTHVDYSARLQTVDTVRAGRLATLLREFHRRTDCPLLVNTSFNVRDQPIVCSPTDAYDCFMATDMDVLAMGNFVLLKEQQPAAQVQTLATLRGKGPSQVPALMVGGRFVELDEAATPRQLRVFGAGLVVVSGVAALVALRSTGFPTAWWSLSGLLAVCAAIYWAFPPARQSIYRAFMYAAFPVNWIVSTGVLAVIYYGILTPIALCMRLLRRDTLQLRPDRNTSTCWRERNPLIDRDRYLRQF